MKEYNVIKTINGKHGILYNVGDVLTSDNESLINFMLENEFTEPIATPEMEIVEIDLATFFYNVANKNDIVVKYPSPLALKVLSALKENKYDVRYTSKHDYRTGLIDGCDLNDKKTDAFPVKLLIIPIGD